MIAFEVFDSILDAAFVVDSDGKVVYCNDAGATFCQTSARRVINKVKLSDLIELHETGILPFTEESQGRLSPTPFIETEYTMPKAGKSGKVQLAVRPVADNQWAFFIRDVSLEEALHSKYRSELAQKEDYARNLEKLVEARTAELRSVNQTLNAILNSLGQGFFTFDAQGNCGNVYTRVCEDVIEGIPLNRKAWEVLHVPETEHGQFNKWMDSLFKEVLPFDDLKVLGPDLFPHSAKRRVTLEYYPIRRENDVISEVVVVATDKTAEYQAQVELERERQYAAMIVKYTNNKEQFLQFLLSVKQSLSHLRAMATQPLAAEGIAESFRVLHTVEGEAGTFSLGELRQLSRLSQHILEPFKSQSVITPEAHERYVESLKSIETHFEEFLKDNESLFRLPEGDDARTLELSYKNVMDFWSDLQKSPSSDSLTQKYSEYFLKVPIESRLKYYDSLIQGVAEKLGKRIKPLAIEGGNLRIMPEPYQKFFAGLVHAFRNAVDHGLESPEDREFMGKDPAGSIKVQVNPSQGGIQMIITDDGQGIDPSIIRKKLAEKFPGRDFSAQSDEEIIQNVCMPGFSSRESIGEFSGRGVGLDALREEVVKMGGTLRLKSKVGEGTSIEIFVPDLASKNGLLRSA